MTRNVRCAADAADLDFLVVDDFLSARDCDQLTAAYRDGSDHYETWHRDAFWKNRLLGHRDVERGAALHLHDLVERGIWKVNRFYNQLFPLYADVLHLVGWPPGMSMTPHADNANENGDPHEFAWRDFSGVVYLNDDFKGGDLYLPKQDVVIHPRKGMLVSLPCGLSHMHGVTEVTSGQRITAAFFLTRDFHRADADLLDAVGA